jgi:AraC family transcriptional regulator
VYDASSLIVQRQLSGQKVVSSTDAGWNCVLIDQTRWGPCSKEVETVPTNDLRISIAARGIHQVEIFERGRWVRATVREGAFAITPPGAADRLRWSTRTSFETIQLFVPGEILEGAAQQLRRAGQSAPRVEFPDISYDPAVIAVAGALLGAARCGAPDLYAQQTAHWLVMHLLVSHGRGSTPERREQPASSARRISRAIELIRAKYSQPLSLEDLAAAACMSKFHFARQFRIQTGVSPHRFLTQERMLAARRLLRTTATPVGVIARSVGYAQTAHFCDAFRSATGLTPQQFREQEPD